MQLIHSGPLGVSSDLQLIEKHLPLDNATLVELGCGAAYITRLMAEKFPIAHLFAAEVDQIQHKKNLQITDLPHVEFTLAGMQSIPAADNSIDAVIMLKSLHHVPVELLPQGFSEIHRILKPGGLLYISEPVFAGQFNEILRLFNDEKTVRQAAFDAIQQAIDSKQFTLKDEIHFISQSRFADFDEFEQRILKATHSVFDINEALFTEIKSRFEQHLDPQGTAVFDNPMRVDLLQKR